MPVSITLEEAQSRLKELVDRLAPGEEIALLENHQPVAKIVGVRPARPAPGLGTGSIL